MKSSTKIVVAFLIVILGLLAFYSGWTYPRTIVSIPVSFTIGADQKTTAFSVPILDDKGEVQISVQSGAALWNAQIASGNQTIWEHSAGQGEQTSYNSGWLKLDGGNYNFTFRTIGVGSLNAAITVTTKGGFW